MKRYVFYEDQTGAIRHIHHVVADEQDFVDIDDADLRATVARMIDGDDMSSLVADVTVASSRATTQSVDLEHRQVVMERVRRPSDRAARREVRS